VDVLTALEKLYARFGRECRAGDLVFAEGEANTEMYFVLDGAVEVVKRNPEGRDVVLARLAKGDFFGEMSLLLGESRSATIRAAEDRTRIFRISPGNFDTIVKLQPAIAIQMCKTLAQRLRETSKKVKG